MQAGPRKNWPRCRASAWIATSENAFARGTKLADCSNPIDLEPEGAILTIRDQETDFVDLRLLKRNCVEYASASGRRFEGGKRKRHDFPLSRCGRKASPVRQGLTRAPWPKAQLVGLSIPPDSDFQSREAGKPDLLDFDASRCKAASALQ